MSELEPIDSNEEKVWELLEKATPAEPGPFFARTVLREIRAIESESSIWTQVSKFFSVQRIAFAGFTAAIVVFAVVAMQNEPSNLDVRPAFASTEPAESAVFDPASEIVSVEYFGDLMAVADPGLLDDEALGELFF